METLQQTDRGHAIWIESPWMGGTQAAGTPVLVYDPERRSVVLTRRLGLPVHPVQGAQQALSTQLLAATGYVVGALRSLRRMDIEVGGLGGGLEVLAAMSLGPAEHDVGGLLALDIDQAVALAEAGAIEDEGAVSLLRYAQRHLFPPRPMMILVAGPYRSGTGDDPARLADNVAAMEACVMPLYQAGHLPVLGEWLALPTARLAGSRQHGDDVYDAVFHPHAQRMLANCDAVLRIGGPSAGADLMVDTARRLGKQVFGSLEEVPGMRKPRLVEHMLLSA